MFTGIIKNVIKIERLKKGTEDISIHIRLPFPVNIGDSLSINGACLTVSQILGNTSIFNASSETVERSSLSQLRIGDHLNIEQSLNVNDLLHGHLVYGHIDGVGKVLNIKEKPDSSEFSIEHPSELSMFIAEKGSITLDGVSLTVTEVNKKSFKVVLIRHTLLNTNFKYKKRGDVLNIEVDPMARYLQRLAEFK
ncbi:riboflavin synthase [candidate division WOR-3 bacterium]|nr:riboflavin synthase [candidate division WOR-3 bacterium]